MLARSQASLLERYSRTFAEITSSVQCESAGVEAMMDLAIASRLLIVFVFGFFCLSVSDNRAAHQQKRMYQVFTALQQKVEKILKIFFRA
jgi:hypothetical protein